MTILRLLFPFLFPTLPQRRAKLAAAAATLRDDAQQTVANVAAAMAVLAASAAEAAEVKRAAERMLA